MEIEEMYKLNYEEFVEHKLKEARELLTKNEPNVWDKKDVEENVFQVSFKIMQDYRPIFVDYLERKWKIVESKKQQKIANNSNWIAIGIAIGSMFTAVVVSSRIAP